MTTLPELEEALRKSLTLVHEGKARDTFVNPPHPAVRLVYVSDRISSHDYGLPFLMRRHGEVRNASTIYWKLKLERAGIKTDLVAHGRGIDEYLPVELRGNPMLWKRLTVVHDAEMELVENIGRNRLLGSAYKQYADPSYGRVVYGQLLPEGLQKGDLLDPPLWTPTTKAPKGSPDEPLPANEVDEVHPEHRPLTLTVLNLMTAVCEGTGKATYGDTKLEFGRNKVSGELMVCDEIGSFDSSRIWPLAVVASWLRGNPGIGVDKDFIRVEMERLGIKSYCPPTKEGALAVERMRPSEDFIRQAEALSLESLAITTGMELEEFHADVLDIPANL